MQAILSQVEVTTLLSFLRNAAWTRSPLKAAGYADADDACSCGAVSDDLPRRLPECERAAALRESTFFSTNLDRSGDVVGSESAVS